jgi:Fe2+ or Zn2+ uptake regulation protein
MEDIIAVIDKLKKQGERITSLRREIITLFALKNVPLSALEIQKQLFKKGFGANKTSVYRQLVVLQKYTLIHEVQFGDRIKRYELSKKDGHHHHLVCIRCKKN